MVITNNLASSGTLGHRFSFRTKEILRPVWEAQDQVQGWGECEGYVPLVSEVEGALHIQGVGCGAKVSEWDETEGECDHGTGVTKGWGETEESEEGHGQGCECRGGRGCARGHDLGRAILACHDRIGCSDTQLMTGSAGHLS